MIIKKIKKNRGFVLLFAITLSSILLAIALGVANIALKEVKFGTSVRSSNDAFFAADTGIECALFNDKSGGGIFIAGGPGEVICLDRTITLSGTFPSWNFVISGLGSRGESCVEVNVDKATFPETKIISKGYDTGEEVNDPPTCYSSNSNRVERQIETRY